MYHYSAKNAEIYSRLGILGTTYEVFFNEVARLAGNLQGQIVLDFGTGAGRSAKLLQTLGAQKVIGVDHNTHMIQQAQQHEGKEMEFHLIDTTLPFHENYFDTVVSIAVFSEMRGLKEMGEAVKEIYRVLKPSGQFIIATTNPDSIGREYINYKYQEKPNLKSGDLITCMVKGKEPFDIHDVFWRVDDCLAVLTASGFSVEHVTFPVATGEGWLDETKVAPDVVIKAIK